MLLAQDNPQLNINLQNANQNDVTKKTIGVNPNTPLDKIFHQVITYIFIIAVILVLMYMIWGAIEWIQSGGDKDKVKGARGKIVNALIGLAILALSFLVLKIVGLILNIDIFSSFTLPVLGCPPGATTC